MNRVRAATTAALLALACMGLAAAGEAPPAAALKKPEATIPFANQRSIRDWQADKREGVWIQDLRKDWFYAKLLGPCWGLDFATSLGFETRGTSTLDRTGYIVVPGEDRCAIMSLVRSDAPPPKEKRKAAKAGETRAEAAATP